MSARIEPRDWERYFGRRARRRGGPLKALGNVLLFLVIVGALSFGGTTLFQYGIEQQQAEATARAVQISTQNAEILAAQTARAAEEQTAGDETATAGAAAATSPAPTAEAEIGIGTAIASGNLRNEPLIAPETIIGQLCAGDQLAFLERRQLAETTWYRIRVTATGPDCDPQRVTAGSSGWASAVLTGEPLP
jgi:hypothetical protein